MPSLDQRHASPLVKVLLLGESKTGKTGALASLARAGYKLLILDFDNGLDYLFAELRNEPEILRNIHSETFRDRVTLDTMGNVKLKSSAKAFANAMKALDNGIDGLGPAEELGPEWIVVPDSLWSAGRAAFYEHKKLQPSNDPRQNYFGAQQMIMAMLERLTDASFNAHVIVMTHMTLVEMENNITREFPSAIGKAICTDIPKLFNRMLVAQTKGAGKGTKRVISTVPVRTLAATSGEVKGAVPEELPIETGLATFFSAITRGGI